jgi:hypothetical protein
MLFTLDPLVTAAHAIVESRLFDVPSGFALAGVTGVPGILADAVGPAVVVWPVFILRLLSLLGGKASSQVRISFTLKSGVLTS